MIAYLASALAPDAAHSSGCLFVWQGEGNSYFVRSRFNLHSFWADHKAVLPLHYAAYLVEVGCKKLPPPTSLDGLFRRGQIH